MTIFLSVLASLFNLLSGGSYLVQVIRGKSIPNPATWLIWVVVTIINTLTYVSVVHGNVWVSLSSMVLALGIVCIFLFSLFKGKFSKLGIIEIMSISLAFAIGLFWQLSGNALVSNIALQGVFLISFYPTLVALRAHQTKEKPLAWFFASASYTLQILNVFISSSPLSALAFPIVNLVGNGTIGVIALFQNKEDIVN